MFNKGSEVFFRIIPQEDKVIFQQIGIEEMYNNIKGGFVRKAILPAKKKKDIPSSQQYQDPQFVIENSNQYKLIHLSQLYKNQIPIFPEDEERSSFIQPQKIYNSFLAQSGVISYDYLRTLFITQTINKQGYYRYFVKRNGEYFLEDCDDLIPVQRNTWKPLWSLSSQHPWQLLLLKVWIKQCGSFQNIYKAKPFKFLQAFGLSIYQTFNFRKQLKFIKNECLPLQKKKENQNYFAMNKNDVIIIAKTIQDKTVEKAGLIPNFAAYRILRMTPPQQVPLYRTYSSLPCYWVGSYSPVVNTNLNKVYDPKMLLDLQRNFLMTQSEVTRYFNKFYVVPFEVIQAERIITQDCINLNVQANKPIWLCFQVKSPYGMLAISIQLPKVRNQKGKYPQFRYFLSKQKNQQQILRSHFRPDVRGSEREGNKYIESSCDKWQYYRIDYVQGYHNWGSFFCKAVEGFYVLYIDADYTGPLNVRFDAYLTITRPEIYKPSQEQIKEIFDSTFFSISRDMAVQASLSNNTFQESIALNNCFDELGYGSISVRTLTKATHRVAMRVFPQKLKQAGLRLLAHYDHIMQKNSEGESKNFVLVSSRGKPQIVVLEKIVKRSQNTIGAVFPPPGTVQFFKIFPLSTNYV